MSSLNRSAVSRGRLARRSAATMTGVPCSSVPLTMRTSLPAKPVVAGEHVRRHAEPRHMADMAGPARVRPGHRDEDLLRRSVRLTAVNDRESLSATRPRSKPPSRTRPRATRPSESGETRALRTRVARSRARLSRGCRHEARRSIDARSVSASVESAHRARLASAERSRGRARGVAAWISELVRNGARAPSPRPSTGCAIDRACSTPSTRWWTRRSRARRGLTSGLGDVSSERAARSDRRQTLSTGQQRQQRTAGSATGVSGRVCGRLKLREYGQDRPERRQERRRRRRGRLSGGGRARLRRYRSRRRPRA